MKNDRKYLAHVFESISAIGDYLAGRTWESFEDDRMTQAAVVRELEIIGEALNRLSKEFTQKHPEIILRDAIAMRNFLIHEYFDVDTRVVWDTCRNDLPVLKKALQKYL